ncbi:molybdopterin oxidoreductase Fe4S4 region [Striga asiatica]|uniref:Molybdopterin oxidoreductase Fe4S4 region n=1 Tax=Striga asiatica TaxID=4170 RepID=A0A5A7QK58_STRAF|nr:molybdopterin oxidoreductase Fe4S4 region [Striga asiatica]
MAEGLLEDLKLKEDIKRYLALLDLEQFEDVIPFAFKTLTLEFFTTIAKHENGKYLTARLKGKEYKITDRVLKEIYECKSQTKTRHSPAGFQVDPHWALLTPCEKYKKTGASSGLLTDVGHAVIHKYISHMVFGKRESNKVIEQQVFILWSVSRDKPVSLLQYLKNALFDIRNDTRRGPNLGHVVADFAEFFGVEIDEPKVSAQYIAERELSAAGFIDDRYTIRPIQKRRSYKIYMASIGRQVAPSSAAAGTSIDSAGEASDDEDEDDSEADGHPTHGTIQPPPSMGAHTDAFFQSAPPVWFSEYEARNEARWTTFTQQNDARWTSFVESNDARWTEQTTRWNEFVHGNEAHWTAHDSRWDTWAAQQYQQLSLE